MFRDKRFRIMFITICILMLSFFVFLVYLGSYWSYVYLLIVILVLSLILYDKSRSINELESLALQIDSVLYEGKQFEFEQYEEGAVAVLKNEISKMVVHINNQNNLLHKEKNHLATTMEDIAHQLRTPLTSAMLNMSLLKESANNGKDLHLIRNTNDLFIQMDWLITSLLKISKLDAKMINFDRVKIKVIDLVSESLKPFAVLLDIHNIQVSIDIDESIYLEVDKNWFIEALQIIIKNAINESNNNSMIEIIAYEDYFSKKIMIKDYGKGIEAQDLPFIFERYYQKEAGKLSGFGIGLSLCQAIVNQHGASIKAENEVNKGAVFTIKFPK